MDDLFFIDGYYLDEYQINAIKCNKNLLVIAGAGSGKTSTILGKVKYLINNGYKENEILCISLTNEATNGLKSKLIDIGYNIDCYTFHKLGFNIIKMYLNDINIVDSSYLEYIVDEYFYSICRFSYRKYYIIFLFKNKYDIILDMPSFILYKKNIVTFINLLKNKGLGIDFIYDLHRKNIFNYNYLFILEIFRIYENELKSSNLIDFNDMIIHANYLINKHNINLHYKYIIIDEFQDSSKIRLMLIQSIMRFNNSKIMCVGDDYQSIYRFAGSDLQLFLNFNEYFDNSEILYLKNTYRFSNQLLSLSTSFICKNKYQFKKEMISSKYNSKPLKIYYCSNKQKGLEHLLKITGNNCMVIGRNNNDIYKYANKESINNINYYTAHKSKGLESENIIIINLINDILGFPIKIKNSKIINCILNHELYKYDEERRMFYVAITRTKNNVYLLIDNNMSCFVKELIKDYKEYIEFLH